MIVTLDNVLSAREIRWLRAQLVCLPWQAGRASAGQQARAVKHNRQADDRAQVTQRLSAFVLDKVSADPRFVAAALPQICYPPKFNRYGPGESYGTHVDAAILRDPRRGVSLRSDMSVTVFLSSPQDYDGGVLEIDTRFGVQEIKLAAGALVLYPASSLHRVTPVVSGERLAAFFWVQSLIRDDSVRSALFDLDHSIQALSTHDGVDAQVLRNLGAVYHNLLRVHAEC